MWKLIFQFLIYCNTFPCYQVIRKKLKLVDYDTVLSVIQIFSRKTCTTRFLSDIFLTIRHLTICVLKKWPGWFYGGNWSSVIYREAELRLKREGQRLREGNDRQRHDGTPHRNGRFTLKRFNPTLPICIFLQKHGWYKCFHHVND